MRTHTLRSLARLGAVIAVGAGATLAATPAQAAETGVNTSTGSVALHYEQTKGMPTSIETGFVGPSVAKINVGIDIDPVANGGPLYSIDMPRGAQVLASWSTDKKIVLKAQNGTSVDGLVKVHHTLTPKVDFKFDAFGLTAAFTYDANGLVNKIPGSHFFFDSQASQQFAPWGFAGVDTKLNAPNVADSTLFSMGMDALPDFVSNNITGSFGVRASTKPTFSYKTTKISLSGASAAISGATSEITVPAVDGDFMEVMAAVEGTMDVKGSLSIQPFVHTDTIFDHNLSLDFGIDVMSFDYTVPSQKVNYPTAVVHIPMPNVHVPASGVDIAKGSSSKTVSIENSGEKEAVAKFKSSDPKFSVPGDTVTIPPKSKYDLKISFASDGAGAASADITVLSSDADSPEQTFKVGANGADVGGSDSSDDADPQQRAAADNGCGCRTAGTSSSVPGWAGLGLAGIAGVIAVRRRRRSA